MQLRDYQQNAVKNIYGYIKQGSNRIMVCSPTGSGKSAIIAQVASDAASRGKKVLIICHRHTLMNQLANTLSRISNQSVSCIAPGKTSKQSSVYIAMIQSLSKRDLPEGIDVIIVDEAHVVSHFAAFRRVMNAYFGNIWTLGKAVLIGFTATPFRTNKKESFCQFFTRTVTVASASMLVNRGYLTPARLFAYDDSLDLSGLSSNDGDYAISDLVKLCTPEFNQDVVSKWLANFKGTKTIAFCVNRAHARSLQDEFKSYGIESDLVTGDLSNEKCKKVLENFRDNKFSVLISVGKLTEGFDQPDIETVLITRASRSVALILQMIGRGFRLSEGKEVFNVVDFGQCITHLTKVLGDDIFGEMSFSLCTRYKKLTSNAKAVKICPHCNNEIPQQALVCPECESILKTPKLDIKESLSEFPDLVEVFTGADKKKLEFLRKELVNTVAKGHNPFTIINKYHGKYGNFPTKSWIKGAILGGLKTDESMGIYKWYLRQVGCSDAVIKFMLDLEFGGVIETTEIDGAKLIGLDTTVVTSESLAHAYSSNITKVPLNVLALIYNYYNSKINNR